MKREATRKGRGMCNDYNRNLGEGKSIIPLFLFPPFYPKVFLSRNFSRTIYHPKERVCEFIYVKNSSKTKNNPINLFFPPYFPPLFFDAPSPSPLPSFQIFIPPHRSSASPTVLLFSLLPTIPSPPGEFSTPPSDFLTHTHPAPSSTPSSSCTRYSPSSTWW